MVILPSVLPLFFVHLVQHFDDDGTLDVGSDVRRLRRDLEDVKVWIGFQVDLSWAFLHELVT